MKGEVQFKSEKLAVLIDADNTSANIIEALLKEISKFGTAYIKRVYGDWTNPQMNSWKKVLNNFAIVPIQQFSYTTGKNSTDSALIIDAMDLLYTDKVDGFCIVSSDSDFTRLAHRIRQDGVLVYGFGKQQTPQAFVASCDRFIQTELLETNSDEISIKKASISQNPQLEKTSDEKHKLNQILKEVYENVAQENGNANIGTIGQQLLRFDPAFDVRVYGYKKLGELLKATGFFEINGNDAKLK